MSSRMAKFTLSSILIKKLLQLIHRGRQKNLGGSKVQQV
jgi:hypothetical protein